MWISAFHLSVLNVNDTELNCAVESLGNNEHEFVGINSKVQIKVRRLKKFGKGLKMNRNELLKSLMSLTSILLSRLSEVIPLL